MYKLEKPYANNQKYDFIVEYGSSGKDLEIEETDLALYALEPWETLEGDEVIENKEQWEIEQAQKEKIRIANLNLTGADVERGIYRAKGMDFEDILDMVSANPPSGLDVKALKIELKANHFYRGNPYVSAIGNLLGFTEEQLDKFFKTNDYTVLLSVEEDEGVEDDTTI